MKASARRFVSGFVVCVLIVAGCLTAVPTCAATGVLYWDANGATAGSGDTGGNWSGSNWTTDSTGQSATGLWVSGSDAVFSAGSDGTGAIGVTVAGRARLLTISRCPLAA